MKSQFLARPFALLSFVLMATLGLVACGPADQPTATESDTEAAAAPADDAVVYEPAFPQDVSDEGLSAADTEQQAEHSHADGTTHDHGDEGHGDNDHDEDDHDHGDGGTHDH